jgi:hypothetical protein
MPGHGGSKHELVLRKVAQLLVSYEDDEVRFCVGDDQLMGATLDKNKNGPSEHCPDLLIYVKDYEYPVVVEIGSYDPDKWDIPVIHVSFDLKVTGIGKLSKQTNSVIERLSRDLK